MLGVLFLAPLLAGALLVLYIVCQPPAPLWEGVHFSPMLMDNKGQLMRLALSPDDKYRLHAKLEHIPEHVRQAVILYEDKYFYNHPGVNLFSLVRAAKSLITSSRRMGASTIAMQVARMRYKVVSSTVQGKLHQMLLALQLIWHYGHDTVLEAYFSLAPYGGNIEGIEAASRVYFHTSARELSKIEALALCLVPQNPQKRAFKRGARGHLLFHPDLERARQILHKKWNAAYPAQAVPEKSPPLRVYTLKDLPFIAPHLSLELLQSSAPHTVKARPLYSTIDSAQQKIVENSLRQFLRQNAVYGLKNAAAMVVHWPSMEVRALAGSANFYDATIDGQVDGTKAKRSPGSTLKPFIYALALEQGLIHPQSMLMDAPRSFAAYNPENFDKQFQGPLPAHEALRLSRNVPAIELAARLEPSLYTFLQRAQVGLKKDDSHYGLSLVLGGAEMSMRQLVTLYAMLANGGIWQPLRFTSSFAWHEYEKAHNTAQNPKVLLSPEAALATIYMLQSPTYSKQNTAKQPLPLRYKTGTSNGFRDAWTLGIVGPYVLAVWLGNFDNSSNRMLVGTRAALPLYKNLSHMLAWHEPLQDSFDQKYKETSLVQIPTCRDTGDVHTALCPETVQTWFIPGRSPVSNSNIYQKMWIDPESGLRLCEPNAQAQEVIGEFWPAELYDLFAAAGVYKPLPPKFATDCEPWQKSLRAHTQVPSLSILSPRQGLIYHKNIHASTSLALQAVSSGEAKTFFWFINKEFVGSSTAHTPLFWQMRLGRHELRVVDDLGQSQHRVFTVTP